jgi:hypothetical protein
MCKGIVKEFNDCRGRIAYLPWAREYGIRIIGLEESCDDMPEHFHSDTWWREDGL